MLGYAAQNSYIVHASGDALDRVTELVGAYPAVRAIVTDAARHDNRMSSVVLGVVNSAAFRMRGIDAADRTLKTEAGSK